MTALPKNIQQDIVTLYSSRYKEYGEDIKTVGWSNEPDQLLRFKVLLQNLDIRGKTILDVGCGLGGIIPYLDSLSGGNYAYIGLDITEPFIDHAREKFGRRNNHTFMHGEFLSLEKNLQCDIALLSGSLNFNMQGHNLEYAKKTMNKMFTLARECAALNLFTTYVDYMEEKHFHYSPEEMFAHAKGLTRHVSLYHDYPLWEFTLQLHKKA